MANRMLAQRVHRVFLSFPDTVGSFPEDKALLVGNPVRAGFHEPPDQQAARERLGLDDLPTVFVCGGSQGARRLNDAMMDALGRFESGEAQFLWMTGKHDVERARKAAVESPVRVEVFSFVDDMVTACSAADIVVSRAGASSTAELATLHKPAVLVPFPHAADSHQEQNARAFEEIGAAILLQDKDCSGERLTGVMRELLVNPKRRRAMADAAGTLARPGAAEAIVEELFRIVFGETTEE
jgi:UDP-N-acetylglucosamine--N-acetylmuramyl-(pentapeptide) pyrophosphoryl-undecaprenol N-acetylglucosamine transferase